jgi:hypothetical protein
MKLRLFDYFAIILSAAVVGASAWFAYAGSARAGDVVVEASGKQWMYPLSTARRVTVPGPLGDTVVVIEAGSARVVDSPCPDKLCVAMAAVSKPGQWIACLPNKVFVRVRGTSGEKLDDSSW